MKESYEQEADIMLLKHWPIKSPFQVAPPTIIRQAAVAYAALRHSQQEYCFIHSERLALALE